MQNNIFDAIVVGSGITGGWAAKELTESLAEDVPETTKKFLLAESLQE